MKISAAVILTAMICVPVTATALGTSSQSLVVTGSTTVKPLMVELQKEFERYANVEMFVTGGGSGVGISSTLNGVADIGMISRDLKPYEGGGVLKEHRIALDAVVVIVNVSVVPDGDQLNLTLNDLARIYSGELTNWQEITGFYLPIAVVSREEGSGSRDCFEEALRDAGNTDFVMKDRDVLSINNTGSMIAAVRDIQGAIGYININVSGGLPDRIKTVTIEGVEATPNTIANGNYAISRDLVLVTNGDPQGMAKFFIEWILSEDGQNIVENAGFVRVPT